MTDCKADSGAGEEVFLLQGSEEGVFAGDPWRFLKGEQWVVMGPNGSGKSYLASILADDIPLRGIRLKVNERVEGHIAMVTFAQQQDQLAGCWLQARWHEIDEDILTVGNFLSYEQVNEINPFEVRPDESRERAAFADRRNSLALLFKLGPLMEHRLPSLSNGEMRRVLLVHALLKDPALLVLDDPFAGLDPGMRERLKEALDGLAAQGLSMVMMLRSREEIPSCANRLLTLGGLKILSQGRLGPDGRAGGGEAPLPATAEDWGVSLKPSDPAGEEVVALHGLTIRYGEELPLVKDLEWRVRKGERWLVVGPNGSGKTTLMSLITGDNPRAYAVDVRVFGRPRVPGENLWAVRSRIGQVSPEIQCYFSPGTPIREAVYEGLCDGTGEALEETPANRARATALLDRFGFPLSSRDRSFASLSAGEQRLLLLARALFQDPDLLILDEPCLNLDGEVRDRVLEVIGQYLEEHPELTVICIAHRVENIPSGMDHLLDLGKLGR